jgi:hypothetical protein
MSRSQLLPAIARTVLWGHPRSPREEAGLLKGPPVSVRLRPGVLSGDHALQPCASALFAAFVPGMAPASYHARGSSLRRTNGVIPGIERAGSRHAANIPYFGMSPFFSIDKRRTRRNSQRKID